MRLKKIYIMQCSYVLDYREKKTIRFQMSQCLFLLMPEVFTQCDERNPISSSVALTGRKKFTFYASCT